MARKALIEEDQDFESAEDVIRTLQPDEPILCISKNSLKDSAETFLELFPGLTLYAVKCAPHSLIIKSLSKLGINHFDTASLEEIKLIKSINPTAKCYFNHPIKKKKEIELAFSQFGIRDFVIDSSNELDKIASIIDISQITLQIRLNTKTGSTSYDFSNKFGMNTDEVVNLLKLLKGSKTKLALSFHVGSQCENPEAYKWALSLCKKVIEESEVNLEYLNIGGGFPGYYPQRIIPPLTVYFNLIKECSDFFKLPPLLCEPGRSLVYNSGTLITQVIGRKEDKLYLNDGLYGSMGEIDYAKINPEVRAISLKNRLTTDLQRYKIFGPTCDSYDALKYQFCLPKNIQEGDWILLSDLGAYSISLTSKFNGFTSDKAYLVY